MIFENIDESEVLCNQLAMDVAQAFCQNYSELEKNFYIRWAGNPNDPTSGRTMLPDMNTVFKAPFGDMYPQIYLFVLERTSPFLLNGKGNTKTKIASLRSLLERGLLEHVEQVAHQCHGVDGEGKVVTSEFATQTAQTCVEMIKKLAEGRKRNDDTTDEAIVEAKTTLKKTRESWKLDISSLLGVMGQEINQSLLCAQQAVDILQKAQRMEREGLGIEEKTPQIEQPVEVEISSAPLSAENLKRREKVETSNGWGSQGKQSAP